MATQQQPERHQYDDVDSIDEIDEAWREKLRRDPQVIFHQRASDDVPPFVSSFWVDEPIDVLELLGLRGEDDES